eukprot:CAMPEP_0181510684 /NCGR_PEP_ID=MMETSP1110-20121109/61015_1 /TAXON_ID=174948 /ORGANISM="Symbiodinium sp., Strain CCMP421" /LENGTH=79 /DNA_ID=CAMNT_0023640337 /DNA_START=193 /DNA_END=431 /DNA_ORIENTATION=-
MCGRMAFSTLAHSAPQLVTSSRVTTLPQAPVQSLGSVGGCMSTAQAQISSSAASWPVTAENRSKEEMAARTMHSATAAV